MTLRTNEIGLLQMDGIMSGEEFEKAFRLAIEGCKKVYQLQKESLKNKYASAKETVDEDEKTEEGEVNQ